MLLSQKIPYDLMSNEDRIQMEKKRIGKKICRADIYDPKLLQDREKTGSKSFRCLITRSISSDRPPIDYQLLLILTISGVLVH